MKWIAILLAACLLVGCVADRPDLYVSNATDCSAPCWYGILPGESTMTETESMLRSLSVVTELDFGTSFNQEGKTARWRFSLGQAYGYANFKNAVLQYLTFRPRDLHLGEVIDRIGFPDHIAAGYEPVEEIVYSINLYYPTKGVAVSVADSPAGALTEAQRMTRDLRIDSIRYFEPMELKTFLTEIDGRSESNAQQILDRLQVWPGYGPNVVHVGK